MSKLEKDVYPKPWWGVKTLDNIPKNAFVCEIVGQLVRKKSMLSHFLCLYTVYYIHSVRSL